MFCKKYDEDSIQNIILSITRLQNQFHQHMQINTIKMEYDFVDKMIKLEIFKFLLSQPLLFYVSIHSNELANII